MLKVGPKNDLTSIYDDLVKNPENADFRILYIIISIYYLNRI